METTSPQKPSPAARSPGTLRRIHLMVRSNWISSTGAFLATLAILGLLTSYYLQAQGSWAGPYLGIVTVLVLPALLLFAVLLIPVGLLLYRKQLKARMETLADQPLYLARAVVAITMVNFAGVGMVGYAGVSYMSSVQFCGKACHTVMEPEYVTYQDSPHARVECVACHVGPGADWFIKSKLNGVNQLLGVITDNYSRPIPTPLHNLRPANETCTNCHWPEKHLGTKLMVRTHYIDNEANTEFTNVLLMRTGGKAPDGTIHGIHWHAHPDTVLEYLASNEEGKTTWQKEDVEPSIPWMRVKYADGSTKVFAAKGVDHDAQPNGKLRRMDCNDCHNRSAHRFDRAPDAVDRAIAHDLISKKLPFIKKRALAALTKDWTRKNAADGIRRTMQEAYSADGNLDQEKVGLLDQAIKELTRIWLRNIYPDRKLHWDSYRNLKSHFGCMRCHDGKHTDRKGNVLTQDCDNCHVVLSQREQPTTVLKDLGLGNKK